MATGKLHVNGITYTLDGEYAAEDEDRWQAISSAVESIAMNGKNAATFSIRVAGQKRGLWVRTGGVATIAAWLEEETAGRGLL